MMTTRLSQSPHPPMLSEENMQLLAHAYAGKLLLRPEIAISDRHFTQLLTAHLFAPIQAIQRKRFSHIHICQRCGNKKRSLFGMMNCARCQKRHLYCRNCIDMGRVMACEPLYYWTGQQPAWSNVENPCVWEGRLTTHQQIGADRIVETIQSKNNELLVWGVCGAGKSEMLFQGIEAALLQDERVCIATPRADVVRELLPRFKEVFPDIKIHGLYGGSADRSGIAQLTIATTHQLYRFKHAFDIMIVDEVDAFPYHADPSLPFVTERAKKNHGSIIYLTATPRKEQKLNIRRKTLPHVFIPTRYHGHPLPVPTFKMCFSLQKDLENGLPPHAFFHWFKQREKKQRQLLIFVPTIQLAETLSRRLKVVLPNQRICSVHAYDDKREEKIRAFREQSYSILVTTTILERGVTFPSIDVIVLDAGHVVFDEAALIQIAGRAGRSAQDPTGEVVFYHDGQTNDMVQAVHDIRLMNKRGGF